MSAKQDHSAETPAPIALLRVDLAHEYFPGGFATFRVAPLPATLQACRRLGLRLVRAGSSLTLYVTADALRNVSRADYRAALAAATLCWQIAPLAAEFPAFTDVAVVGATQALIFTNLAAGAKGGTLTVKSTASAKDVWPRQPLRFSFRPPHALPEGTELELENPSGDTLAQITVTDPNLIAIDVTDFGSGLYRLMQGGDELTAWFADERGASPVLPSTVLVLPGKLLVAAFANAQGNMLADAQLPVYSATYPARAVIWRYHVFNAKTDEALSIVNFAGESLAADDAASGAAAKRARSHKSARAAKAPFVAVTDPALPAAQSFEAVRPLKLAVRPVQRFALNSGSATRFAPLPLAGLSFGRSVRNAAICSEIFVYL